jgi:FkbM family methyltransferase
MSSNVLQDTVSSLYSQKNIEFVEDFCSKNSVPRFILGRNIYAESVLSQISVDGIIDDFTDDKCFLDVPIIKLDQVPKGALVLCVAGGRPLSAKGLLEKRNIRNLDYFAFYKLSKLKLLPIRFNEGFEADYKINNLEYQWIYSKLADEESKNYFKKLVGFRFTYDMKYLDGFTHREDIQYFEDFLNLGDEAEIFLDVGCFDGYTSLEFAKRCPDYKSIHIFEPDPVNFLVCKRALSSFKNVYFHPIGLSKSKASLKFDIQGSSSKFSEDGAVTINVNRLDDVLHEKPTFIKFDIEGGESEAILGASMTILNSHPKLAVAVYHSAGDFWRLPKQILAIRDDYEIYLRHYTECIYETVMFFIPKLSEE